MSSKAVIKDVGRVFIQMGGKGNASKIVDVFSELQSENKWNSYFNGFNFPFFFFLPPLDTFFFVTQLTMMKKTPPLRRKKEGKRNRRRTKITRRKTSQGLL